MRNMMTAAIALAGLVAVTSGAQAVDVSKAIEAKATAEEAWALLGDFCGIKNWHPVVAACEASEMDGAKMRTLTTGDGAVLLEKLTQWDDAGRSYSYQIIESPLPVANYAATIAGSTGTTADGMVTITWTSTFDAKGVTDEEAAGVIAGIYDAGLGSLKAKLEAE